jgi:hypothetical protein
VKHRHIRALALCGLSAASTLLGSEPAEACGGFFCSQQAPVNQAAERIVFADNGDGTITAVIQILYQGPSEKFSWLLPIGSVPDQDQIAVSSDYAFSALQQATNPQYTLQTVTIGNCKTQRSVGVNYSPTAPVADSAEHEGGVQVDASGEVGSFEYVVISVEDSFADPAAPALAWLQQNGYDVTPQGAALLGPYLADGMHLLALRLTKGSDTGSIRPIEITYKADAPMIPIKLTAVAANQDMGVLTWALSNARAVPFNYNSLELNEARINWFSPATNYNQVVSEAADAAGGQGFVTEFAAPSTQLAGGVWSEFMEEQWQSLRQSNQQSTLAGQDPYYSLQANYSGWSGFWDVVRRVGVAPAGVSFEDFQHCSNPRVFGLDRDDVERCYANQLNYVYADLIAGLESDVIEPVRRFQRMIDRTGYATRLYTTLSAAEMIVDPVFRFNPDLPDVSNVHQATRVVECREDLYPQEAPWHITLPNGEVLRGGPNSTGLWPVEVAAQPANRRVLMLSTSGEGRVVEDNSDQIASQLAEYNATVPHAPKRDGGLCSLPAAPASCARALLLGIAAIVGVGWLRRRQRA